MIQQTLISKRVNKVDNVIHIADVHIRNFKRHDEYESVFNRVYDYCKEQVQQDKNTIIYLAGDIVHAKTDMSPELIVMTRNFLVNLSDIAPVLLISGNHDCYTPDHEVLTKNGWVTIGQYVNNGMKDQVASFDSDGRTIQFQTPTSIIKKNFTGEMVNIVGKNVDMVVTPNHRVIHHTASTDKFYTKDAKDIHTNMYIPVNGVVSNYVEDTYAKLLGFAFADATFVEKTKNSRRIQFHFKKDRKVQFLSTLLDKINYKFNLRPQKDGTSYISIYGDLANKIYDFFGGKKELDWSILNNDINFLKSFVDGYLSGDGHKVKGKEFYSFVNINQRNTEILGTMFHFVGGISRVELSGKLKGNYENSKPQYSGNASFSDRIKTTKVKSVSKMEYNDYVYCLSVPSTYLLIRRNGKIFVSGNCNLNNRNRLDALTPIVDSLSTPDFFYLKDTGVYNLGGVNFILNAVHEDPDNFIKAEDVVGDGIKVVFYHGAIDRADIGFGQTIKNNRVNMDMFKDFDFGMFGDIHSFQYLYPNNKFAYAGSLIQQNFGEGLVHGIIHWNLREGKSTFVQIPNDWCHYTIDIDDGKFVNLPTEFSIHNRIRVRSYNTPNSELMKAVAKLKSIVKVDDIRIQKFSTKPTNGQTQSMVSIGDVRDVEYQNKLIGDYLEKEFAVEEEVIDEVRKINRTINTNLDKSVVLRNVIWNPIKFEFDNMFSYGEGNKIDFSQMNGTYGIFAANASGKSSVLDALMFCIFDKCSRTFKASQVLNNKKDTFRCKFQFQINGKDYWIERIATKDKRGHVKVNVDFWHEESGEKISLNGDDRDGTNFAIRNYLGTYDDFIITAFSLQGNNTNFIDKAQRERKDLLAQFLDLNLFEELSVIASDEIKSVQTLIKEYSRQDYSTKIANANDNLKRSQLDLDEINEERDLYRSRLDSKNEVIMELTKALKPIDDRLMNHNLEELTQKKDEFVRKIVSCREETERLEIELGNENKILSELQTQFDSIDSDKLQQDWQVLQETIQSISKTKHKLENIRLQIDHNQSKIDKLSTHEYDPGCKFCTNNVFVQDARSAEEILVDLNKELGILEFELAELEVIEKKLDYVEEQKKNYQDLERKVLGKQKQIHEIEKKISQNGITCDDLTSKTEKIEDLIISYVQNEGIIKGNQKIQSKISVAERERNDFTSELKRLETKYITLAGEIKVYEKTIQDCAESIKKLQELEKQFKAYDFYLKAVNRNGVPYQLISDAMPKVQAEVNSILSQIVDFEILFETDGKSINTYIVYDDENFWPLEMTSGMEKFISSLAIRTALVNVSSLPRPNFMAIDEGWGTLDSDNLNSIHMFFDYMKTQFDFVLTISHIDSMRDIVDSIIEIKKENGFSSVRF